MTCLDVRWPRVASLLLALGLVVPGCGAAEPEPVVEDPIPEAITLSFVTPEPLELAPVETREIELLVRPATAKPIALDFVGTALDASLDQPSVTADAEGRVRFKVRAPSHPATFHLRARTEGAEPDDLAISVSELGFARVRAKPTYKGVRSIETLTAGVLAGTGCAALAGPLESEPPGALAASSIWPKPPVVDSAPIGAPLALTLRGDTYTWGCVDVRDLAIGETRDVEIHLQDLPIALARTDLALSLSFEPESATWAALLDASADAIAARAFPVSASPATTLLDAMADSLGTLDASAFSLARVGSGWDAKLDAHFAAANLSPHDATLDFANAGSSWAATAKAGTLEARLRGQSGGENLAQFEPLSLGGVKAAKAGMAESPLMKWTAEPNDKVRLGGALVWQPSRFVASAADNAAPALEGSPGNAHEGLAAVLGCADVAELLAGFSNCKAACMKSLCEAGVEARWQAGAAASESEGEGALITVELTGEVEVDGDRVPRALRATWLGSVTDGLNKSAVFGPAKAQAPAKPK